MKLKDFIAQLETLRKEMGDDTEVVTRSLSHTWDPELRITETQIIIEF